MSQSIIWGGTGGRYEVPPDKTATAAAINTNSNLIKIDWGGLIDTLEGDSFDSPIEVNPTRITWDRLKNDCASSSSASLCVRINRTGVSFVGLQNNGGIAYSPRYFPRAGICTTGIDNLTTFTNSATQKWHMIFSSEGNFFGVIHTYLNEFCTSQYQNLFVYKTYFVQAYSGGVPSESVTREALSPPQITLQSGLHEIIITFSDQSSQAIALDYDPVWVEILAGNDCPPGTCFFCDHGATRCCFGQAQGDRHPLIHSFNKR